MNRAELQNIIGVIALQLTDNQILELAPIATNNPTGLAKTVANIENDANINSPVGALMSRARRGDIRQPKTKQPLAAPLERAHALFTGKMRDLLDVPWNEDERIEYAIDYALDHCGAYGEALMLTEQQLRAELNAPRWHPTETNPRVPADPAKYTPHAKLMQEAHGSTWSIEDMKPLTRGSD